MVFKTMKLDEITWSLSVVTKEKMFKAPSWDISDENLGHIDRV